jgi:IS5 family transposase
MQGVQREWEHKIERRKSSVSGKAGYVFLMVKSQFGYRKTVYHGLEKNRCRLMLLLGSANLLMCARISQCRAWFRFGQYVQ